LIYLDHNATTPPCQAAIDAANLAMTEAWANPSSVHRAGQTARRLVETARRDLATLLGAAPRDIVFTGDGTEAIDMAIHGSIRNAVRSDSVNIVTCPTEHAAVRESLETLANTRGIEIREAPIARTGVVDPDEVASLIDDSTELVSLHWANNETGVIQPIERIAEICHDRRVRLHTDATQMVGKLPTDLSAVPGISLLTCSPHKFGGLKGVGVLYTRRGSGWVSPRPGSQELGRRGGTENVPGIAAAGAAAREAIERLADDSNRNNTQELRDTFEENVLRACEGAAVISADAERLPNTSSIAFPTLESEAMLLLLSERGVCASAGAACSSGSLEPSPVLLAMGIEPRLAHGTVRFSLGTTTTRQETEQATEIIAQAFRTLAASSGSL